MEPWADSVAVAVAARAPLAPSAAQALRDTFLGASELRLILASGEGELEDFSLIEDGKVAEAALPTPFGTPNQPSAAQSALEQRRLIFIDTSTPGRDQLVDWRRLHAGGAGISWLLAAPLGNAARRDERVLGTVLVGGRGCRPSVDGQWLQEWASEMGALIGHASVQLMESSLEVLGVIFPPRVLEQVVANAAKKTGQVDLAQVLRSHASLALSNGDPNSSRSSLEGRPPPPASPAQAGEASVAAGATVPAAPEWGVVLGSGDAVGPSPFAAMAGAERNSPTPSYTTSAAAALLRQASRGSGASSAMLRQLSLHQLSQQSGLPLLSQAAPEEVPLTPHTEKDLAGFEDILEYDHRVSLERRPSMAPERARSHPTTSLEHCIAAATGSMEEAAAGGLDAAVCAAEAHSAEQAAAAAAAGAAAAPDSQQQGQQQQQQQLLPVFDESWQRGQEQAGGGGGGTGAWRAPSGGPATPALASAASLPPLVRVPWQNKPLVNPLSTQQEAGAGRDSGDAASPLLSPREGSVSPPPSLPALKKSGSFGSFFGSGGSVPSAEAYASLRKEASLKEAGSGKPPRAPPSKPSSQDNGMAACTAGLASVGSAPSTSSVQALASSAAARQGWDLGFASPALEAGFRRWLAPYMLRSDAVLGLVHGMVLATALIRALMQSADMIAPSTLLPLAGLLLVAAPALPAWLRPDWWSTHRLLALAVTRVLVTLVFAAHSVLAAGGSAASVAAAAEAACGSSAVCCQAVHAFVDSGAATLAILPIRFPLPFSLHVPLHLLCLWILTAGSSLAHVRGGGTMSATGAILAQLLLGFLLSSLLAYGRERHLRASFLSNRQVPAQPGARQKRVQASAVPSS